jgi:ParB family transcriptional regulator, chromosome partitioning protein
MRAGFFETVSENLPRIVELDLEKIEINPDQPRKYFDENTIRDLASDIERRGLLQPITVKSHGENAYLLAAGERRLRAHRFLQRTTIAAIITTGDTDEIALVENIQREDLRPWNWLKPSIA